MRRLSCPVLALVLLGCGGGGGGHASARSARFETLNVASGIPDAHLLSYDGSIVIGWGTNLSVEWQGSTLATTIQRGHGLDVEYVVAVSGNGRRFLCSAAQPVGNPRPVVFGKGDDYTLLVAPANAPYPYPIGMSDDGKTVLCTDAPQSTPWKPKPYLVKDGAATYLPLPAGTTVASVAAISTNGSTVVGGMAGKAVRWVEGGEPQDLGAGSAYASVVNRDGTVIAGMRDPSSGGTRPVPFRWTAATGVQDLPTGLGSADCFVEGISADGKTILLSVREADQQFRGYLWKLGVGTRSLADLFAAAGGDPKTINGTDVAALSGDGKTVIGRGLIVSNSGATAGSWKLTLP